MRVLQVQVWALDISPHFATCRAAGSVTWRPCLPTLPWLSDPQHGYTLDTCVETEAETRMVLHAENWIDKCRHVNYCGRYTTR